MSIEDLLAPLPEKTRLGGPGPFVINLSASSAPIDLPPKGFVDCERGVHVYQVQRIEDRRPRYRLRVGPFANEDDADAVLLRVRDLYPSALTATADADDLRSIAGLQAKSPTPPPAVSAPDKPAARPEEREALAAKSPARPALQAAAKPAVPTLVEAVTKPAPAAEGTNARSIAEVAVRPVVPTLVEAVAKPAVAAAAKPAVAEVAKPAVAAVVKPAVAETSKPTVTAAAQPADTEMPKPTVAAAVKPAGAEVMQPAIAATVKPAVTEVMKPVIAAAVKAAVAEVMKPAIAAAVKAAVAEVAKPANAASSKPPAPEAVKPPVPAIAKPVIPEAVKPPVAVMAKPVISEAAKPPFAALTKPAISEAVKPAVAAPPKPAAPEVARPKIAAAAKPIETQHDRHVPSLESTQTIRALTQLELEDDEASRWFAIQLAMSEEPFDPETLPNLDIFSVYRLYSVAGIEQGRIVHVLRLGFFTDQIAAGAVASYLAAFYEKPSTKRVSAAERERFADESFEARKDVGATGKQAVIEITNERYIREKRIAQAATK